MIRIVLVDDHAVLREGLKALIESESDMEVIGEADSGGKAVELARELAPDVILMDIAMNGITGIEAARRIVSENPSVKVVALSMHIERKFVTEMLKAGASGYLWKNGAYREVNQAVRAVTSGERYLSPAITSVLVDEYMDRVKRAEDSTPGKLTSRELEVLKLLAEGHSSKEIAVKLGVSSKTVDVYRKRIMDKLNLFSVAELTKYAIIEGITEI